MKLELVKKVGRLNNKKVPLLNFENGLNQEGFAVENKLRWNILHDAVVSYSFNMFQISNRYKSFFSSLPKFHTVQKVESAAKCCGLANGFDQRSLQKTSLVTR